MHRYGSSTVSCWTGGSGAVWPTTSTRGHGRRCRLGSSGCAGGASSAPTCGAAPPRNRPPRYTPRAPRSGGRLSPPARAALVATPASAGRATGSRAVPCHHDFVRDGRDLPASSDGAVTVSRTRVGRTSVARCSATALPVSRATPATRRVESTVGSDINHAARVASTGQLAAWAPGFARTCAAATWVAGADALAPRAHAAIRGATPDTEVGCGPVALVAPIGAPGAVFCALGARGAWQASSAPRTTKACACGRAAHSRATPIHGTMASSANRGRPAFPRSTTAGSVTEAAGAGARLKPTPTPTDCRRYTAAVVTAPSASAGTTASRDATSSAMPATSAATSEAGRPRVRAAAPTRTGPSGTCAVGACAFCGNDNA